LLECLSTIRCNKIRGKKECVHFPVLLGPFCH
jgi:hypothetical protein